MARRVHRRGAYGRKASAALRTLYPIVLGLGGWFLGVLVVLVAFPSLPIDDAALGVLSVGVPVGLGIYWAWVNRDWATKTKAAGFAAAAGGALVGAWLGFHATEGLLAVITTIAGAAVGANLTLIILDIAWDRAVRDRFSETAPTEVVQASPSRV